MIKKMMAGVLLAALAITAIAPAAVSASTDKNIVERAIQVNEKTPIFDTLLAAATCTPGIADALATSDGITLFAPTDGAFRKLGLTKSNVCTALDDAARADVLTYHVFAGGAVKYRDAQALATRAGTPIQMLNGDDALLVKSGWFGRLAVDGANSKPSRVLLPNVMASNGIIHVVNNVLLP